MNVTVTIILFIDGLQVKTNLSAANVDISCGVMQVIKIKNEVEKTKRTRKKYHAVINE